MSKKPQDINEFLKEVEKDLGKDVIFKLGDSPNQDIGRLSSGSITLDGALGGGYPKGRIIEIYGAESSGKAQPLSSKILTPNGWVKMGDVELGLEICTPDGGTSNILGIYPQGKQDVYEITLDDKSTVRCTLDHLWEVYNRTSNQDYSYVKSLEELLKIGIKGNNGVYKFRVRNTKPAYYNSIEDKLKVDPYLMGLLLGDGSFVDSTPKFSTSDTELIDSVSKCLEELYMVTTKIKGTKYDYSLKKKEKSHRKSELALELEELNLNKKLSYEKHIPNKYLYTSVENRIALLQGLMDSDGTVTKRSGTSVYFSTSSPLLRDNFIDLTRGLGIRTTVKSKKTHYINENGKRVDGRTAYTISLVLGESDILPFRLKRKLDVFIKNKENVEKDYSFRYITKVEKVGEEECQCIKVGHPDCLYITDNYTVTHNTTLAIHAMVECQKEGGKVAFIDMEHAFSKQYAKDLGLDTDELVFTQPDSGEQALELADKLISSELFQLVIIDSVATLVPQKELEGEMGDSQMGLHARLMSQALRKISPKTKKSNCTVIFINQTRSKIGVMFGSPETTTGGNALKFYASVRLKTTRIGSTKDQSGELSANSTKVEVKKNKTAPPFKVAEFEIEFGKGIDKIGELMDVAVELGVLEKSGSWYSYNGEKLGQGKPRVKELLEDNTELVNEIINKSYELAIQE